jgi:hypothetical protein
MLALAAGWLLAISFMAVASPIGLDGAHKQPIQISTFNLFMVVMLLTRGVTCLAATSTKKKALPGEPARREPVKMVATVS